MFHRWFYRRTDAFLCNSRATLDLVKNSAPDLAESRIKVMYNPAPPQEPAGEDEIAAWRRRLLLKPGELLVLSVGRLAPEKGHRYLLEAFRILLRTHAASRLVIAGGGAELENLEFVASELGISERVSLPGFVVALTPLYRLADMVVQPSLPGYESFSNAALEALSHGLPIIATTAGGFPELIEQGKDGLLVPHSDVNALAHAMIRLADSKQLRSNLGSAAKRKIQADFAPEKKAGELEHYLCAFSGSAHEDCPKATSRDL